MGEVECNLLERKRLVDEWIIKDLNKEEMEIFIERDVYQKVA